MGHLALKMAESPILRGPPKRGDSTNDVVQTPPTASSAQPPDASPTSFLAIFNEWDRDGNGRIDFEEFNEVMKTLRQRKTSLLTDVEANLATADSYGVDMEAIFSSLDTDGDGQIDWNEFMIAAGISDGDGQTQMNDYEENVHKMPEKFHGTLKGKGSVVVSRVEKETQAAIVFSKEEGMPLCIIHHLTAEFPVVDTAELTDDDFCLITDEFNSAGGSITISGTTAACKAAWQMIVFLKGNLPGLLTKLRSGNMMAGDFMSDLNLKGVIADDKVWQFAVDEATYLWKKVIASHVFHFE